MRVKKAIAAQRSYRRGKIVALISSFGSTLALVIYAAILHNGIETTQKQWEDFSATETDAAEHLFLLTSTMGYGGIIHNFKNFVIRSDPSYADRARENIAFSNDILEGYASTLSNSDDLQALNVIRATIEEYKENLALSKVYLKQGMSTSEVDQMVYVDDAPALGGVAFSVDARLREQN